MADEEDRSLARLIDERARAIVREEKDAAARAEIESQRQAHRRELQDAVVDLERALERNRSVQGKGDEKAEPPSALAVGVLLAVLCVLGMVPHYLVFPLLHWTPASLACPALCPGCSPSMRILYSESTSGDSTYYGDFTYLCRNANVDVDSVSLTDVEQSRHAELAPYSVNGILVGFIEAVVTVALLLPYLVRRIRRARAREEITLNEKLKKARDELAALDAGEPRTSATEPYR